MPRRERYIMFAQQIHHVAKGDTRELAGAEGGSKMRVFQLGIRNYELGMKGREAPICLFYTNLINRFVHDPYL